MVSLFDYFDPAHPDPKSYEDETFPAERPGMVEGPGPHDLPEGRRDGVAAARLLHRRHRGHRAREIADYYRDGWFPV